MASYEHCVDGAWLSCVFGSQYCRFSVEKSKHSLQNGKRCGVKSDNNNNYINIEGFGSCNSAEIGPDGVKKNLWEKFGETLSNIFLNEAEADAQCAPTFSHYWHQYKLNVFTNNMQKLLFSKEGASSYLLCDYGGIVKFVTSGQHGETLADLEDYDLAAAKAILGEATVERMIEEMGEESFKNLWNKFNQANEGGKILPFGAGNNDIAGVGATGLSFYFDYNRGVFRTTQEGLQSKAGFNSMYDYAAESLAMDIDTAVIRFEYNGEDYDLRLWKGNYGTATESWTGQPFGTGSEVGLYRSGVESEEGFGGVIMDATNKLFSAMQNKQMVPASELNAMNYSTTAQLEDTSSDQKFKEVTSVGDAWNLVIDPNSNFKGNIEDLLMTTTIRSDDPKFLEAIKEQLDKNPNISKVDLAGNELSFEWGSESDSLKENLAYEMQKAAAEKRQEKGGFLLSEQIAWADEHGYDWFEQTLNDLDSELLDTAVSLVDLIESIEQIVQDGQEWVSEAAEEWKNQASKLLESLTG